MGKAHLQYFIQFQVDQAAGGYHQHKELHIDLQPVIDRTGERRQHLLLPGIKSAQVVAKAKVKSSRKVHYHLS